MRVRKRPVEVEAMLWTGDNYPELTQWSNEIWGYDPSGGTLRIHTLEGIMTANKGDYIIRGVLGEFYPCKPEIFNSTYEVISL